MHTYVALTPCSYHKEPAVRYVERGERMTSLTADFPVKADVAGGY